MKDERLSGLAMISIESDMASRLDMRHVILDSLLVVAKSSKVTKKPF